MLPTTNPLCEQQEKRKYESTFVESIATINYNLPEKTSAGRGAVQDEQNQNRNSTLVSLAKMPQNDVPILSAMRCHNLISTYQSHTSEVLYCGVGRNKRPITTNHTHTLHQQQLGWLQNELNASRLATIVLTHHTPSTSGTSSPFFETSQDQEVLLRGHGFSSDLTGLIAASPNLICWAYGHTHFNNVQMLYNKTFLLSNQRGYPSAKGHGDYKTNFNIKVKLSSTNSCIQVRQNILPIQQFAIPTQQQSVPEPTIFDQILAKKILAPYIYEDDCCVAFDDNNPQAPVHFLVIPKDKDGANRISQTDEKHIPLLGHLLYVAKHVATTIKGLCNVRDENTGLGLGGYRIVINDGEIAGQSIPGLCVHVLGGRPLSWPPG